MKKNVLFLFSVIVGCFLFVACGQPKQYERTDVGIKTTIDSIEIEIQFYSPQMLRVIKSPTEAAYEKESLSVVKQAQRTSLRISQVSDNIQIKTQELNVKLDLSTGNISFYNAKDGLLLKEQSNQFTPIVDGGNPGFQVGQTFLLEKEESIYGLGQHQKGVMNYRNESQLLQQENTKIAVPFIQSIKGYGIYWDNYSSTQFTDNESGTTFLSEVGDCIDYYFMYGENMDGTIACMRKLTGQVPLFPLWTWGYWQSRERYVSQEQLIGIVQKYRDLQIPLDGIIQDWQYWSTDNAYWNGVEFLNPEFPDPLQMVQDIHDLNANVIISVWPSFGPKTQPYQVFKEKGMLLPMESFPQPDSVRNYNAYQEEARTIYWDFLNKYLFSIGMDGWWLDATEPEYSNITDAQLDFPTGLGTFRKVRNAYPIQTVGGVYDNQRKVSDEKRVFILTRSAFAGQQRYGANSWSGDIDGSWEALRNQIPAGLSFSLTGMPYWNSDIGGFWVRGGSSAYADYRELYVRWLQFGTFCPMMRSHGTSTPREIWQFGEKGDWAYDAIDKFIQLRYRLLPYNYSLSWDVTSNAGSVMRMLSMDFPQDKKVHDMGSQYMYGKSFLVVPVTQSFYVKEEKANSTTDFSNTQIYPVYLPQGADWYDFWTNEKLQGGQEIQRETPIDMMPLYVKAGSIVPMGPVVQYATEKNWENLELKIYPGANAEFILYEDENNNYNYEKGMYSTIKILWDNSSKKMTIENRQGEFPGMLKERTFTVSLIGSEKSEKIGYKGKAVTINLN
jgi:alpha-D-xyloside xylohydrolase